MQGVLVQRLFVALEKSELAVKGKVPARSITDLNHQLPDIHSRLKNPSNNGIHKQQRLSDPKIRQKQFHTVQIDDARRTSLETSDPGHPTRQSSHWKDTGVMEIHG